MTRQETRLKRTPFITLRDKPPTLVDQIRPENHNSLYKKVYAIRDSLSNKLMCEIVNPQLPLAGYSDLSAVIDLRSFMESNCLQPDFGFDTVTLDPIS